MSRFVIASLVLAVTVMAWVLVLQNRAPVAEEGWNGATDPVEIIEARRVLMLQMEQLMTPIDEFTVSGDGDLPALRSAAATIEAMMLAFPHLFPAATNLYDAADRESPTYTLPRLWEDFERFQSFAETSERAAAAIAASEDAASLRQSARSLRATCDGCHAVFTRPYTPPKVTQEDREFDFDSMFPAK